MRYKIFMLMLFIMHYASAQDITENTMDAQIEKVTVFLQNAQIFRTGKLTLLNGRSAVVIKNLSPYVDEKSIQVQADGDFTILSVNHRTNYLHENQKNETIDSLQHLLSSKEEAIQQELAVLEVLKEKQSLLNENKKLGGENVGIRLTELDKAITFYSDQLTTIKKQELISKNKISAFQDEQEKIEQQLKELNAKKDLPSTEIVIIVEASKSTLANFNITYLVANACWFPQYDVRVKDIESPIELVYKAEVYQNTGTDWKNVRLSFSNGNPNQSGTAPQLATWFLNFARNTIFQQSYNSPGASITGTVSGTVNDENGVPLPGVNIVVKGTSIGTISDVDGRYQLTLPQHATYLSFSYVGFVAQEVPINNTTININLQPDVQSLQEVVVMGYGVAGSDFSDYRTRETKSAAKPITTTVAVNQTTVEFDVEIPYSIKSDGKQLSVDLKHYEIAADYEYYAVPKLDKDAFLLANITNWDQYTLLEGEANLYFEDAYVGRTVLDAQSLNDTLQISLGRDKNIVISREKVDQFSKIKVLGSNTTESRGYKIMVRNKKAQPIQLTLMDQLPVSAISEIAVDPKELSNGKLDANTGEITWKLSLAPQQQTEFTWDYTVKYPRREKVILE